MIQGGDFLKVRKTHWLAMCICSGLPHNAHALCHDREMGQAPRASMEPAMQTKTSWHDTLGRDCCHRCAPMALCTTSQLRAHLLCS